MFSWGILTNESCSFVHLSSYLFCFEMKKFCNADMDIDIMPGFESSKEQPANSGM